MLYLAAQCSFIYFLHVAETQQWNSVILCELELINHWQFLQKLKQTIVLYNLRTTKWQQKIQRRTNLPSTLITFLTVYIDMQLHLDRSARQGPAQGSHLWCSYSVTLTQKYKSALSTTWYNCHFHSLPLTAPEGLHTPTPLINVTNPLGISKQSFGLMQHLFKIQKTFFNL